MRGFVPPPRGLLARSPEDKYERLQMVGKGSFGQVYLVRDKSTGERLVMKCISVAGMGGEEKAEAMREAKLLQRLDHPNIIRYVESFETPAGLRIVTEYAAKGDLHQVIQARKGKRLPENQILDWFLQLCLGVKYLHDRHILHRDIKTSNIFLSEKALIKIGDFGISKVLAFTMQFARTAVGTPYYMSPEICQNKPYNNRSDVWAMGCVLYELCTLKHAFEANNMNGLIHEILRGRYKPIHPSYSEEMRELIACMLNRAAEKRPSLHQLVQKPVLKKRMKAFLEGPRPTPEGAQAPPASSRKTSAAQAKDEVAPPTPPQQQQQRPLRSPARRPSAVAAAAGGSSPRALRLKSKAAAGGGVGLLPRAARHPPPVRYQRPVFPPHHHNAQEYAPDHHQNQPVPYNPYRDYAQRAAGLEAMDAREQCAAAYARRQGQPSPSSASESPAGMPSPPRSAGGLGAPPAQVMRRAPRPGGAFIPRRHEVRQAEKESVSEAVSRAQRRVSEMKRARRQEVHDRRAELDRRAEVLREEAKLKQLQEADRNRRAVRDQLAKQREWKRRKPAQRGLPPMPVGRQQYAHDDASTATPTPSAVAQRPTLPQQLVANAPLPNVPAPINPPSPFFRKNANYESPLVTPKFARKQPTLPMEVPGAGVYVPPGANQPVLMKIDVDQVQVPAYAPSRHAELPPLGGGGPQPAAVPEEPSGEVADMVATMREILNTADEDDSSDGIFVDAAADHGGALGGPAGAGFMKFGFDPLHKFELNNATYRLPDLRKDDSLSNRVEVLRCHLEDLFGAPKLMQVHRLLGDAQEEDAGNRAIAAAKSILGERQVPYLPLVLQLVFCEDVLNSNTM